MGTRRLSLCPHPSVILLQIQGTGSERRSLPKSWARSSTEQRLFLAPFVFSSSFLLLLLAGFPLATRTPPLQERLKRPKGSTPTLRRLAGKKVPVFLSGLGGFSSFARPAAAAVASSSPNGGCSDPRPSFLLSRLSLPPCSLFRIRFPGCWILSGCSTKRGAQKGQEGEGRRGLLPQPPKPSARRRSGFPFDPYFIFLPLAFLLDLFFF